MFLKYYFRLYNIVFNIVYSVYEGKFIKYRDGDLLIVIFMLYLIVSCFKSSY